MHKKDLMMKKQNIIESRKLQQQQQMKKQFTPRHTCLKCNKVFKDNNFLELHMKEDHGKVAIKREKVETKRPTTPKNLKEAVKARITKLPSPPKARTPDVPKPKPKPTPNAHLPVLPKPPSEEFYYKTFTAEELIKLGYFTETSPDLFVPPLITGDIDSPIKQTTLEEPVVKPPEPGACDGTFILGL